MGANYSETERLLKQRTILQDAPKGNIPRSCHLSALSMVTSIEIKNFRGFAELTVSDLSPINVIVGDNASGKTAFLETIYLTVSGQAQQPYTLKQWRGQEVRFQSSVDSVAEALYADLFYDPKSGEPISIKLKGRGFENRQLKISKSSGVVVPLQKQQQNRKERRRSTKQKSSSLTPVAAMTATIPMELTWTDEYNNAHTTRASLSPAGLQFEGTNEPLPNCYLYAAMSQVVPSEAAGFFSALEKSRNIEKFKKIFLSVFDHIVDIKLGDSGGTSVLLADVPWAKQLLPLPLLSGGTNRAATVLLAITHRQNGLVMIDEVENGIFHARQRDFSRALLELARTYEAQLFLTTHSYEWIRNFIEAADEKTEDISFWRLERSKDYRPTMRRFSVQEFQSGMAAGEMR